MSIENSDMMQRMQNDLMDSFDEELELELEDHAFEHMGHDKIQGF